MKSRVEQVLDATREWAFQFNFEEWQPREVIHQYFEKQFGYGGTSPRQMANMFLKRGIARKELEVRLDWHHWRWHVALEATEYNATQELAQGHTAPS